MKDSIIVLDKIGFDKVVKSKRLLITTIQPNSKASGKYVIQVDEKNQLIDSMFIFTVYLDKRYSLKINAHNTSFVKQRLKYYLSPTKY